MRLTEIIATDLPDCWFQCIYELIDHGYRYTVQQGSFAGETRLEFDWVTLQINYPYNEPWDLMLPQIPAHLGIPNPVEPGYIEQYVPYLMHDIKAPDEDYTYGSRIKRQVDIWIYRLRQSPNTNQAILQVAQPSDYYLVDPPCLRHIDLRVKEGKLIFYPYFRSWDAYSGLPANLAALAVLQKYMADEIEIEMGPMIASSKGLHIYSYAEELAKLRTYKNG